ncbi:peptidoglycan DD-metalloendopeptidase family protein [Desulfolithobacter sp.]
MADETLHIIVTGEQGRGRTFVLRTKTIRNSLLGMLLLTLLLGTTSLQGLRYFQKNLHLESKIATLHARLADRDSKLTALNADRESLHQQLAKAAERQLQLEEEKEQLAASFEEKIAALKKEREELLATSINRLDQRSRIIETVMDKLGVELKIEDDPEHSGGLFIAMDGKYGDKLLGRTDHYLEVLNQIPLGRPVNASISSRFGRRTDPMNKKQAFHSGIDFRSNYGDKVRATGDAVVKVSSSNKGLGKYIILDHGNGYETVFAHLSKRLVKRGDRVTRGQVIGLVGNTGRSTGAHLHYELRRNGRAINPMPFFTLAGLDLNANN